jgi:predicted SAM-dependent methyltransferase
MAISPRRLSPFVIPAPVKTCANASLGQGSNAASCSRLTYMNSRCSNYYESHSSDEISEADGLSELQNSYFMLRGSGSCRMNLVSGKFSSNCCLWSCFVRQGACRDSRIAV